MIFVLKNTFILYLNEFDFETEMLSLSLFLSISVELYMQETTYNLRLFEKECASTFVTREESKDQNSLEKKICNLELK